MGDGMSETAPEASASTATPGVDDLDPAAALGAAIHGGTVSPDPDAIDTSDEGLQELARARKEADTPDAKLVADRNWWKAQSRRTEQRLREANTRLGELDDRDKTELQKATSKLAAAEERAVKAERRIWIADAAESYEIPAKFRNRITGSTQNEIEASAEGLAKDLNEMRSELTGQQQNGQPAPAGRSSRRPVESLRSGAAPSGSSDGGGTGSGNDILRGMLDRARGR